MKVLVDNALSPTIAQALRDAGYEATHVLDEGIPHASDSEIIEYAAERGLTILTADSDFAMLIALYDRSEPSLILLNGVLANHPDDHARATIANLPAVVDRLVEGAIVIIEPTRVRVRMLPIADD